MLENSVKHKFLYSSIVFVIAFFSLVFISFSGETKLVILYGSSGNSIAQVFWRSEKSDFSEINSKQCVISSTPFSENEIEINANLDTITSIRIDPATQGNISFDLYNVLIVKKGFKPICVVLNNIKPLNHIVDFNITNKIHFTTNGNDSILMFTKPSVDYEVDAKLLLFNLFVGLLISILFYFLLTLINVGFFSTKSLFLLIGLSVVFSLVTTTAITAKFNASPDESDHFLAAQYFKNNTETPNRRSEESIYTYNQTWNYSRVYQDGFHYLFSGKFSNIFDGVVDNFRSVRLFGAFLIVLFLLFSIKYHKEGLILIPLLLSPQIWYIFSYVNDDFFPLFLSFMLVLITEANKDVLKENLSSNKKNGVIAIIGIALGALFLSKDNYWVFTVFYILYLVGIFIPDFSSLRNCAINIRKKIKVFKTPLFILTLALVVVVIKNIPALPEYELSTDSKLFLEQAQKNKDALFAQGMSGEARFGSFSVMLENWIPSTFKSFNGVYGYMSLFASNNVYRLQLVLVIAILFFLLFYVFKCKEKRILFWALFYFSCLVILLFASSYLFAYKYDYQPQGRYLFPSLPFLGLLVYKISKKIDIKYLLLLFALLFITGVYSFVLYGVQYL